MTLDKIKVTTNKFGNQKVSKTSIEIETSKRKGEYQNDLLMDKAIEEEYDLNFKNKKISKLTDGLYDIKLFHRDVIAADFIPEGKPIPTKKALNSYTYLGD